MGISTTKTSSALLSMTFAYEDAYQATLGDGSSVTVADYSNGAGRLFNIGIFAAANVSEIKVGIAIDNGAEVLADFDSTGTNFFCYATEVSAPTSGLVPLSLDFKSSVLAKVYNDSGGGSNTGGTSMYGYLSHEVDRFIILAGSSIPHRSYTIPNDVMCIMIQGLDGRVGSRIIYPTDDKVDLIQEKIFTFEFNTTINAPTRNWNPSTFSGTKEIIIDGVYYNVSVNNGVIALTSIPYHVTNDEFWERFTTTEQEILIVHNNAKVKTLLYQIRIRPKINLRWQKLINTINSLESASIIGAGRADEIMAV